MTSTNQAGPSRRTLLEYVGAGSVGAAVTGSPARSDAVTPSA